MFVEAPQALAIVAWSTASALEDAVFWDVSQPHACVACAPQMIYIAAKREACDFILDDLEHFLRRLKKCVLVPVPHR